MNENKTSLRNIIALTGAFCAFYMGVGFAGGQEMLQFYVGFGNKGYFGLIITMIIFAIFACYVQVVTNREKETLTEPADIMIFLMGPKIGKIFTWLLLAGLVADAITKTSGAGAAFEEYFGLPNWLGRGIIILLILITILLGLEKLVNIMGTAGPIIILFTIVVTIVAIVQAPMSLSDGSAAAAAMDYTKGAGNWFVSSLKYAGNVLITVTPIWVINGRMSKNVKEARITTFTGLGALVAACLLIIFAQTMNITITGGTQLPNLVLAKTYLPLVSILFSLIILLGMYCSTAADLWYVIRQFTQENTKKYKLMTVIFCVAMYFVTGFVSFDMMVNIVYTVIFWVGFIILAVMVVRIIMKHTGHDADEKYLQLIREIRAKKPVHMQENE